MRTTTFTYLLGLALCVGGCGADSVGAADVVSGGGDFGATQGGVQDMTFARELVRNGQVPPPEALLVEAMFSEHDLPIEGAPCSTLLCLRAALGVAPNADGDAAVWTQLGLSSTIDPESFERPPLAIIATVDVSGSMGWSYGTGQETPNTPGEISRALLASIAAELGPNDSFAMVTYGSTVDTPLGWTSGDSPSIATAIAGLQENGSTDMEGGLVAAYQLAKTAPSGEVRVMLFTDVQPNVGATSGSSFEAMAEAGGEQGVGLTVFGLGLGLGAEIMGAMAHVRGGNAFSLMDGAAVAPFMDDNWPWLASPIAYDLHLAAAPGEELELKAGYGFPGDEPSLDVATVFLSKNKGALLLELAPSGAIDDAAVGIELSYTDAAGDTVEESLRASYTGQALDERGAYMPQIGIDKSVALALLVAGMHEAATAYAEGKPDAIAILDAALTRFADDAAHIGDAALDEEAAFWPELLALMKAGAPQGSMYGQ